MTEKAVAKRAAPKKKAASKGLVSMDDVMSMMADDMRTVSDSMGPVSEGAYISVKGGSFTFQGADLGTEMEVVIVGFANENAYYDTPYDPENPSSPACFSIATAKPVEMVPSEDSVKKQCDNCADCWANEFGSATTGKGKSCRNLRRLMVVSSTELDDISAATEVAFIKVAPTSSRAFDKYVNGIMKLHHRPPYGVITKIVFNEEVDYEALTFEFVGVVNDPAAILALKELSSSHLDDLLLGYDPSNYREPPAKKAPAKKKSVRR